MCRCLRPKIFNLDQGVQFTSPEFTGILESANIRISMAGRGRVFDNIFVERFWRSVKYEEVYLHEYRTVAKARTQLAVYFRFYNRERPQKPYFNMDQVEIVVSRSNGKYFSNNSLRK